MKSVGQTRTVLATRAPRPEQEQEWKMKQQNVIWNGVLSTIVVCMGVGAAKAQSQPSMAPQYTRAVMLDQIAASADPEPVVSADELKWGIDLYTWLPGITGDIGVRGQISEVDVTAFDIFNKAESTFAFSARLQIGQGKWLGYIDGTYIRIASDGVPAAAGLLDFTNEIGMVTCGVYYRVAEWTLGSAGPGSYPLLTLDAGLAGRIMFVSLDLNYTDGLTVERQGSRTWGDPLVAAQFKLHLNNRWQVLLRGDVGAGCSDLSWQMGAFASYHFKLLSKWNASINLGYQAIAATYEEGSGANQFVWDAVMHGPVIFLGVEF